MSIRGTEGTPQERLNFHDGPDNIDLAAVGCWPPNRQPQQRRQWRSTHSQRHSNIACHVGGNCLSKFLSEGTQQAARQRLEALVSRSDRTGSVGRCVLTI